MLGYKEYWNLLNTSVPIVVLWSSLQLKRYFLFFLLFCFSSATRSKYNNLTGCTRCSVLLNSFIFPYSQKIDGTGFLLVIFYLFIGVTAKYQRGGMFPPSSSSSGTVRKSIIWVHLQLSLRVVAWKRLTYRTVKTGIINPHASHPVFPLRIKGAKTQRKNCASALRWDKQKEIYALPYQERQLQRLP